MGSSPPGLDSQCWGWYNYMAGRMGSPKGTVGSVSPFFPPFSLFLPPLYLTQKHTPRNLFFRPLTDTYNYSVSLPCSLSGLPLLPLPPHLSTPESVETPALPNQR